MKQECDVQTIYLGYYRIGVSDENGNLVRHLILL